MQINEISQEGLNRTYRITVAADDITRETENELKNIGKKVRMPGFRPGNIPLKLLKQRYGANVAGDVLQNVVNDATQQVVKQNKLRPAMKPDVNVEDYKDAGDLVFTLRIETMPEMPELPWGEISLERDAYTIEESEVDEALAKLAEHNPGFVPQEGANAKKGSVLTIDFVGKVDGKEFQGGSAQDFRIEIGSGRLIDGFEEQLKGLKAGDEKQVSVTFPDEYFSKDLAGKPATFDVKVKEVAAKETPALDDEFAKARGFENMPALREAMRKELARNYDATARTRLKKRLFDALDERCGFPLPQGMVTAEFDTIWNRLEEAKKANPQEDLYEGRSEEEMRAEYRKLAERRVRLGLLLADIGTRHKLQISRDEMTRAIMAQAQQFPGQEQAVFEFYRKNPERMDELRGPILEEKAVDWILEKVKLADKKISTKDLTLEEEEE